jgi:hypothetical protein
VRVCVLVCSRDQLAKDTSRPAHRTHLPTCPPAHLPTCPPPLNTHTHTHPLHRTAPRRTTQGGDELQGIKRGIMEVADVVAVNKADGNTARAAARAASEYGGCVRLMPHRCGGAASRWCGGAASRWRGAALGPAAPPP